ncbi:MAG: glycosyltransferase [Oligoflexales bacterium]
MKVALIHDWLVEYRGGEKVLLELARLYPEAPIYTLFFQKESLPTELSERDIRYPKALQKFQKIRKILLPFFPSIIESFDLSEFDLIISTSSCVAKGIIPPPTTPHICYIHSPMRYIWDQRHEYLQSLQKFPGLSWSYHWLSSKLRIWDTTSASRVTSFVTNSQYVAARVQTYYGKKSTVIHPPVDLTRFAYTGTPKHDYMLCAGAMVSYKRFDLAIEVSRITQKPLIIAGRGPELKKLRSLAHNLVTIIESPSDEKMLELIQHAKIFLFPGIEDFGIIAVEALSCGTPVIAPKKGGACDFIQHQRNGLLLSQVTAHSLAEAAQEAYDKNWNHKEISQSATPFSCENFNQNIQSHIKQVLKEAH